MFLTAGILILDGWMDGWTFRHARGEGKLDHKKTAKVGTVVARSSFQGHIN